MGGSFEPFLVGPFLGAFPVGSFLWALSCGHFPVGTEALSGALSGYDPF